MRVTQPNEKEISHGRQSRPLLSFHTSSSSFIIAAQRPDVGFIDWLGVRSIRRWYGV